MNNPPVKQHFLPAVYLKQFSVDGPSAERTSMIYRLGRKSHGKVKVKDQCYKDFYNSKAHPVAAEELFGKYEGLYGDLAKKIWANENPSSNHDYFGLIITMLNLHFRSPAYENRTGNERVSIYVNLEGEFLLQSLGVEVDPINPSREHVELFKKHWGVSLMEADEPSLLTSDNPSHIFGSDGLPRLITLPITPRVCAVAFDRRRFSEVWSQSLSAVDVGRLNRLQVHSCIDALFAAEEFTNDDVEAACRIWVNERQAAPGFVGEREWAANYRVLEPVPFDFLR